VNRKGIGVRTDGELAGGCDRSWGHAHIQQVAGKVGEGGAARAGESGSGRRNQIEGVLQVR
jgi:hypothetical protein